MKEGAAIADFMKPDRIVVGTDNPRTGELLKALYDPFTRNHDRMILMDVRSSELTKYAANAMLATKISFMNELANLAERMGADIEKVRRGIGSDPRIGYHFIYPGCGYGGSCFLKDVQALARSGQDYAFDAEVLQAVERVSRGEGMLDPAMTSTVFQEMRKANQAQQAAAFSDLTPQELAVLALVAEGLTNRQIAVKLYLGEGTVRNYVSSVLAKIGVSNRAEAAAYAVKHNINELVPPSNPDTK